MPEEWHQPQTKVTLFAHGARPCLAGVQNVQKWRKRSYPGLVHTETSVLYVHEVFGPVYAALLQATNLLP